MVFIGSVIFYALCANPSFGYSGSMSDTSNQLESDRELTFSQTQGFFDKSIGIRVLIGMVFIFSLFVILHFREVRVEVLELNSIAPGYIVAQVDFDFYDEEASLILRQEALRDIGKIYQISDNQVRQRRIEFENFLIYNQEWRKYTVGNTFEDLFAGIDKI